MGLSYSGSTSFTNNGTTPTCVELGVPVRGTLNRFILVKESGTIAGGSVRIYDRKGACANQLDVNTGKSGVISAIASATGDVQLTSATAHNLRENDSIEFKGAAAVTYPGLLPVKRIVSATVVVLDRAYTANAAGSWQLAPFLPTLLPANHLLFSEAVPASGELAFLSLDRAYMNRDNQDPTLRRPTAALWLEYTPAGGSDAAVFQVAYTATSSTFQ